MNTFNITLDLNKSNVTTPIRLRQGDLDGTTITALILDHGATADLTGLAARFVMELPGGEHYYRKDATVGEGSVTVVINEEQAASVTGRTTRAYFQLLDGETVRASTGSVTVDILPDALEGHTVPADYDSAIQVAIDALDDAVENIADTVEDVLEDHPEWTTTVQDGSVTDAKLYQGTDGILARNARLMYRLDNLLTATLPEGDSATATDAAKTPLAGLSLYGRSTQNGTPTPSAPVAIQSVEGSVVSEVKTGLFVNGSTSVIGTSAGAQTAMAHVSRNTDYTLTYEGGNRCVVGGVDSPNIASGDTVRILFNSNSRVSPKTFNSGENDYVAMFVATSAAPAANIALYAGSTAYPYVPYGHAGLWAKRTSDASTYTVTPIDLQGHALRSLPDGTRDELTVGADGRVTLVQRVGAAVIDGDSIKSISCFSATGSGVGYRHQIDALPGALATNNVADVTLQTNFRADRFAPDRYALNSAFFAPGQAVVYQYNATANFLMVLPASCTTVTLGNAWLAENPVTVLYRLATPQTHDLGWTDAIPLCGPDLTAQSVPTAPFALTYERDLNVTLARLEAAIAELA